MVFNPDTTLVYLAKRPAYVSLAHGLIHADRAIRYQVQESDT